MLDDSEMIRLDSKQFLLRLDDDGEEEEESPSAIVGLGIGIPH